MSPMRFKALFFAAAVAALCSCGLDEPGADIGEPAYIVVLRHHGPDTLPLHLSAVAGEMDLYPLIKNHFAHLAALNVHAYVVSDERAVRLLRSESTVEYIEMVSSFSVLSVEKTISTTTEVQDGVDYEIPDYFKSPLTTFQSSDSACTITYEQFRMFANLPDEKLKPNRSVIYVVDTGIDLLHPTFEGRAVWGFDAVSGASHSLGDRHGHGTYVAGLVVGQHHGIARKSSVIDVRALDENGRGTSVQILSALNYIAGCAAKEKSVIHIINLSFSGERSVAIRDAIRAILEVAVVVAAIGDSSAYSCLTTPANIPDILVVSGVDPLGNVVLPFSNFGECVSIKAPGLLTSSSTPGPWARTASMFRNDRQRGFEVRAASSAGAAGLISGVMALLSDYVQDDPKLSTSATFALRTRFLNNFIKNGSMLHYQGHGNDQKIHKYPFVPCMLGEVDSDWDAAIGRMISNMWITAGTTHVFSHFERVRRQFMESAKHNS